MSNQRRGNGCVGQDKGYSRSEELHIDGIDLGKAREEMKSL